jgi:hypothetical protein
LTDKGDVVDKINDDRTNPLATVELIAPLVQMLLTTHGDDDFRDAYWDNLCTLHQLIFPHKWSPANSDEEAVEQARVMAINLYGIE